MALQKPDPARLAAVDFTVPRRAWRDLPVEFRKGTYNYATPRKHVEALGLPNPREWQPHDADWKLPPDWKRIILDGMKDRLDRYRSFRLFMDICVRCGACADKCHFYLGSGDPRNTPVLRAELLRSVYRRYFTAAGRMFGPLAGARDLTEDVLKEWFYYFYQCTECRRCSVFCPYGIDTAEITMIGRELLGLVGCTIQWVVEPAANCYRTGNHLGIQPHGFKDSLAFAADELEELTGIRIDIPIDRKGAEVLLVVPSADYFGTPHYYTLLGYLMVLHEAGVDYTFSAFASEGGNFGLFASHELMKRLNAKIYAEARRLGVKWILGGECGHMWRVVHQYMGTMNEPADFLEVPVSPVTGTRFDHAASTKMVHVCEFTADLIAHGRLTARSVAERPLERHLPRLVQPGPRDGPLRGAARDPPRRAQSLPRDGGGHDPRAHPVLRQRGGPRHRRELRDADARRAPARDGGERRAHAARRELPRLHLRHRQGHAPAPAGVLGARRRGGRRARTGRQRPRHDRRAPADDRPSRRAARRDRSGPCVIAR